MMLPYVKSTHWARLGRSVLLVCLLVGLLTGVPAQKAVAQSGTPWVPAQVAELSASNCCGDIGSSVALSGTTAIVGGPAVHDNQGVVYIYEQDPTSKAWHDSSTPNKTLKPSASQDQQFGASVAIQGDTLVVSGMRRNPGSDAEPYAYIFARNKGGANNWGLLQILRPTLTHPQGKWLHTQVVINGDIIAISTPYLAQGKGQYKSGSVDLYQRDANGAWGFLTRLTGSKDDDYFGVALALQNGTLVVGATQDCVDSSPVCGMAYIFSRDLGGANQWGLQTTLKPAQPAGDQFYGYSLAMDGTRLAVGAPGFDLHMTADDWGEHSKYVQKSGAAYLYQLTDGNWSETERLTSPVAAGGDNFGIAVALDGSMLAVGASNASLPLTGQGTTYLFTPTNGKMSLYSTLLTDHPKAGDTFGFALDLENDTLIGGAPWREISHEGKDCDGAAYIFKVKQGSGGGDNGGGDNGGGDNGGGDNGGGDNGGGSTAPAIDLNGAAAGSNYSASYTTPLYPAVFTALPIVDATGLSLTLGSTTSLVKATVTLTNPLDGSKELLTATDWGTVHAVYDPLTGVLSLTSDGGSGTLADFQTVLRSVKYLNNSWLPNTTSRSVSFVVNDGNADSNTAVSTISVARTQQPPLITFYIDGQSPFHINETYTVHFTITPQGGAGADLGIPTGSVTLLVGSSGATCTGTLDASGQGTCQIMITQEGNFTLSAGYSGDANYLSGSASLGFAFGPNVIFIPVFGRNMPSAPFQDYTDWPVLGGLQQ